MGNGCQIYQHLTCTWLGLKPSSKYSRNYFFGLVSLGNLEKSFKLEGDRGLERVAVKPVSHSYLVSREKDTEVLF